MEDDNTSDVNGEVEETIHGENTAPEHMKNSVRPEQTEIHGNTNVSDTDSSVDKLPETGSVSILGLAFSSLLTGFGLAVGSTKKNY